jgi:hypothetical protein
MFIDFLKGLTSRYFHFGAAHEQLSHSLTHTELQTLLKQTFDASFIGRRSSACVAHLLTWVLKVVAAT